MRAYQLASTSNLVTSTELGEFLPLAIPTPSSFVFLGCCVQFPLVECFPSLSMSLFYPLHQGTSFILQNPPPSHLLGEALADIVTKLFTHQGWFLTLTHRHPGCDGLVISLRQDSHLAHPHPHLATPWAKHEEYCFSSGSPLNQTLKQGFKFK